MAHNILENDNMVYVGDVPWHGIGIQISPKFSAREAMCAAGLDWNVELMRMAFVQGQNAIGIMPDHWAVVRTDKMIPLGVTSDRYKPLQNAEGFDIFQRVLDTNTAQIETAGSLQNGKIVWALAKINDLDSDVGDNDRVQMYVLMSFGHDGKRAVKCGFTPIRVVCNNTLTMSENSADSRLIRVLHRGNVADNSRAIIDSMDLAAKEFSFTMSEYRKLRSKGVKDLDTLKDYIKVVLDLDGESTRSKNIIDLVAWKAQHGIGNKNHDLTWWNAYNGVTEYLSHDAGRNTDSRYNSLWFGRGANMNQTALTEALRMVA